MVFSDRSLREILGDKNQPDIVLFLAEELLENRKELHNALRTELLDVTTKIYAGLSANPAVGSIKISGVVKEAQELIAAVDAAMETQHDNR